LAEKNWALSSPHRPPQKIPAACEQEGQSEELFVKPQARRQLSQTYVFRDSPSSGNRSNVSSLLLKQSKAQSYIIGAEGWVHRHEDRLISPYIETLDDSNVLQILIRRLNMFALRKIRLHQ
jgi:hypothetical protein